MRTVESSVSKSPSRRSTPTPTPEEATLLRAAKVRDAIKIFVKPTLLKADVKSDELEKAFEENDLKKLIVNLMKHMPEGGIEKFHVSPEARELILEVERILSGSTSISGSGNMPIDGPNDGEAATTFTGSGTKTSNEAAAAVTTSTDSGSSNGGGIMAITSGVSNDSISVTARLKTADAAGTSTGSSSRELSGTASKSANMAAPWQLKRANDAPGKKVTEKELDRRQSELKAMENACSQEVEVMWNKIWGLKQSLKQMNETNEGLEVQLGQCKGENGTLLMQIQHLEGRVEEAKVPAADLKSDDTMIVEQLQERTRELKACQQHCDIAVIPSVLKGFDILLARSKDTFGQKLQETTFARMFTVDFLANALDEVERIKLFYRAEEIFHCLRVFPFRTAQLIDVNYFR
ncbi:hypothetical protein QTG54_015818 [Skeletonema marinoi]|uniref:Uncharacterized protein n=1 Tax=Skeletonema marinoi TaxID=267567 RepID=A0AAD9D5D7_9STRA|nr:hypothetical protein QTG54_015818 [Skeletonema marinoi]